MKELQIKFKSKDQAFSDFEKSLEENGKQHIQSEDVIIFESYKDFQKFLFPRLGILLAIKHHNPNSIYELGKLVDRDVSTLVKDCNALEATGFISLVDTKSSRGSKAPRLKFEYDRIVVHAPVLGLHAVDLAA